jgi:hypothetical protein
VRFRGVELVRRAVDDFRGELPTDVAAGLDAWANRYAKRIRNMMSAGISRGLDPQLWGAQKRFRTVLLDARRGFRELMEMADEADAKYGAGAGDRLAAMAEDIPTTVMDMVERGIDPVHMIGRAPRVPDVTGRRPTFGRGLRRTKLASESGSRRAQQAVEIKPYLNVEADQARRAITNEAAKQIDAQFGKSAADVIGADALDAARQAKYGEALTSEELTAMTRQAGYTPLEPSIGDRITLETRLVPHHVAEAMNNAARPTGPLWRGVHAINRTYKGWVLPLSPKWHVNNTIGNALMAGVYGGIGPVELVTSLRRLSKELGGIRKAFAEGGIPETMPRRLSATGLTTGERIGLGRTEEMMGGLRGKSYQLNEMVDGMTRSAVYLSKLRKGVMPEAALDGALKAMGDFTRMSDFERRYVKEVIPFYAWLRHQTQAMLRLPIEHPARAIWLANLARLYADPAEQKDMHNAFGVPLGGFDIGGLTPFPTDNPLNPATWLRAVTPAASVPLALTTGLNLGGASGLPGQFTRPRGKAAAPLIYNPAETINYLAGMTPLSRLARDVVGYGVSPTGAPEINQGRARYATGYEATGPSVPSGTKSRLRQLAEYAGLPRQSG